jgi:hypothetical protein
MTIWYILCSFGTFFPVWVIFTKKNLATLLQAFVLFGSSCVRRHRRKDIQKFETRIKFHFWLDLGNGFLDLQLLFKISKMGPIFQNCFTYLEKVARAGGPNP